MAISTTVISLRKKCHELLFFFLIGLGIVSSWIWLEESRPSDFLRVEKTLVRELICSLPYVNINDFQIVKIQKFVSLMSLGSYFLKLFFYFIKKQANLTPFYPLDNSGNKNK